VVECIVVPARCSCLIWFDDADADVDVKTTLYTLLCSDDSWLVELQYLSGEFLCLRRKRVAVVRPSVNTYFACRNICTYWKDFRETWHKYSSGESHCSLLTSRLADLSHGDRAAGCVTN